MRHFLREYGHQFVEIEVQKIKIPFTQTARNFFKNIPKLRDLRVINIITDKKANVELSSTTFPCSFKHVKSVDLGCSVSPPAMWNLVEFCTCLELLVFPPLESVDIPEGLRRFQEILERNEHKKLRYLDSSQLCLGGGGNECVRRVCELAFKHDLKLKSFCHKDLLSLGTCASDIADRIQSIGCVNCHHPRPPASGQVALPNVKVVQGVLLGRGTGSF